MPKTHTIPCPSEDVRIVHRAYSGCSDLPTDRMTLEDAIETLADLAHQAGEDGYPVTIDPDNKRIEIESPDDVAMVGDREGTYTIEPVMIAAVECFECGDIVPVGEICRTCADRHDWEPVDLDDDDDDEDEADDCPICEGSSIHTGEICPGCD